MYRPPSPAERRRAALGLWLDAAAILTAALLASLHAWFFSAWWHGPPGEEYQCYALCFPSSGWVIVLLVLNATGVLLALLAGVAALVRGTRLRVVRWAPGPCILFGLSASATLLYASFCVAVGPGQS